MSTPVENYSLAAALNLTQGNLTVCVIKEIMRVLWRTAFIFCASWPKFWG